LKLIAVVFGIVALVVSQQAQAEIVTVNFGNDDYSIGSFRYDDAALPNGSFSDGPGTESLEYYSGQLKSLTLFSFGNPDKAIDLGGYARIKVYHDINDFMLFDIVTFSKNEYLNITLQMDEMPFSGPYLPKSFNDKYLQGNLYFESPDGGANENFNRLTVQPIGSVPEPATWASMILGLAVVGGAMRYRRKSSVLQTVCS
jgi:hypothetical protein